MPRTAEIVHSPIAFQRPMILDGETKEKPELHCILRKGTMVRPEGYVGGRRRPKGVLADNVQATRTGYKVDKYPGWRAEVPFETYFDGQRHSYPEGTCFSAPTSACIARSKLPSKLKPYLHDL